MSGGENKGVCIWLVNGWQTERAEEAEEEEDGSETGSGMGH